MSAISFWQRASEFPPVLVRLLARHKFGPPLNDAEIAAASGIPIHQVFILSQATTWDGVDLPTMHRFLCACGVDFENAKQMERVDSYLRQRPSWKYLRVSPHWRTLYEPLMRRYRKSIVSIATRNP